MTDTAAMNRLWGELVVEELVRCGVTRFCLSSGSRSTPLTVAVAEHPRAEAVMHYDERGAAFFALGCARGSGKPAALVCTSGTAAANYLPAAVEASNAQVPLVVLTADRPPELVDTGANQTIRQTGLYRNFVRWEHALPCPTPDVAPATLLTAIDHAVHQAQGPPAGPVHVNCPFREPLIADCPDGMHSEYLSSVARWKAAQGPYTTYDRPQPPAPSQSGGQVPLSMEAKRVGLVVGCLGSPADRASVRSLAEAAGWPVLADVTSGLRLGAGEVPVLVHYDSLLQSPSLARELRFDAVIHVGGAVTSKRLLEHFRRDPPAEYIHVAAHGVRYDPASCVSRRIVANIPEFCRHLTATATPQVDAKWTTRLQGASKLVARMLDEFANESNTLSEPLLSRILSRDCPADHALFLGNSMPIRDMDAFAASDGSAAPVFANRGASGIDGNVATAAGIATGANSPVTAVLGDLAVLHDLNSLSLLRKAPKPVVLVVVNNDGGGVFHFLPIAGYPEVFEPYFATPHGLRFERAAQMFGLAYASPKTAAEFREAYRELANGNAPGLIEIDTDREENHRLHLRLQAQIVAVLERI